MAASARRSSWPDSATGSSPHGLRGIGGRDGVALGAGSSVGAGSLSVAGWDPSEGASKDVGLISYAGNGVAASAGSARVCTAAAGLADALRIGTGSRGIVETE